MTDASPKQPWQERATAKRESVLALIPPQWRLPSIPAPSEQRDVAGTYMHQFLTPREKEITETDVEGILQHTTTGSWSAEELNCLHEIFFDAALEDARRLDTHLKTHKKPVGPLHGLPVSLKDQFHVRGVETHMGYVGWLGTFQGVTGTSRERVFESEMVRELRSLGAILYVKTSVPHTLMTGETVNNIVGYTLNARNRLLSSGGSSGGEGALIGARGSPIGFGTDIGGSIRIPGAFNGLFAIRPSVGRMPYEGMANSMDGQNTVLSVTGPLAHSVGGLRTMIKAVLSQEPWLHDPGVLELPWREDQAEQVKKAVAPGGGGLAFGVIKDDGAITPYPPVKRAVDMVVQTLENLDHKVIDWDLSLHFKAQDVVTKSWSYDADTDTLSAFALSSEPPAPQTGLHKKTGPGKQANGIEIAANNVAKRELQAAYLAQWNATAARTGTGRPVDAIICPAAPFPAALRGTYTHYLYTTWVNALDYTACTVPVTRVDKKVDAVDEGLVLHGEADKEMMGHYDPEVFDGACVGVQVVGRRLQEEKVLALAEYLRDALAARDRAEPRL